ncbi:hypothetical protein ALC62_06401 [Cyphomyrmex costatus]|uniref:Uncharacterized protein n=1 Tax=Cyphomyrmex costatus TaxID=456900 RepID=A0A195CQ08_9HYME|nr:hypothetical protein ALC62_06401 [Cyphomyrmex costatus]
MKNRVCRGRLRDSPTLRDLGDALSPAKANLLDGNTCEPGTSLYVSVCVSMQYYVSRDRRHRSAPARRPASAPSRRRRHFRPYSYSPCSLRRVSSRNCSRRKNLPRNYQGSRIPSYEIKKILNVGTYWDSITATSAKHAIPTPLKDYPSRCARPYITKKEKNLSRGTFTQITSTTHFSLRISVSKLRTTYRNAHREDWPPSIIQSLYQHDVCYRDVIKCPAVQATTPPGISTHSLCHPRDSHARLSYRVCVAWKGVELRRCVFNGYLSHGPQQGLLYMPLSSVSCNNIPSHLKRNSLFTYHQFRSSGAIRNALTLSKNPVCTRHGSTEDTWYEERVATQQDRSSTWDIPSSSLAKVDRTQRCISSKGEEKEDAVGRGIQKEQAEPRWWWRWHAKEARRIGKRTEPVVRRHLAAPYIFLRLPRFPYPRGNKRRTFPFLLLFVSTPRVSIPRSPIRIVIVVSSCENLAEEKRYGLRFDIFVHCSTMFILDVHRCYNAVLPCQ